MTKRKPRRVYYVTMRVERRVSVLVLATSEDEARASADALDWHDEEEKETLNWSIEKVELEG